jgi:hypothetical protein
MQHIRKFNENKSELDIQYVEECFIEFLDDTPENKNNYTENDTREDTWHHKGQEFWNIQIFFPSFDVRRKNYIDDNFMIKMTEHIDIVNEIYKDIIVSTEKVKIKYPNSDFVFEFSNSEDDWSYRPPVSIGVFIYKEKK